jgi:hypothetical protein
MNSAALIRKITENIQLAREEKITYDVFCENPLTDQQNHEFLFFIKPEITGNEMNIKQEPILELVFDKFSQFGLAVKDIRIMGASYLEKFDVIARHYGVINALSRNPKEYMSAEAQARFRDEFGKTTDQVTLLGSLEFLQHFPQFTADSLNELWQGSKALKLAGGTYCAPVRADNKDIYLINGFHPKQLIHFTEKGRSIVAFTLIGNLDWASARNNFIGKTNPVDAAPGSLRNEILARQKELGLHQVSASRNGFHLSAGPVEGLVELIRYCSNYALDQVKKPDDFLFGRQLKSVLGNENVLKSLENHLVNHHGSYIRVFDLTEEKNSEEALQLLKESIF